MRYLIVILIMLSVSNNVFAEDKIGFSDKGEAVIYMTPNLSDKDIRNLYKTELVQAILDATVVEYGPLKAEPSPIVMERDRQLEEMASGKNIQVAIELTKADWERRLSPIFIPVDKGLLGWRISFIRAESQEAISKINSFDELKRIPAGTGLQWSSTKALEDAGFNVVTSPTFDGLFKMLDRKRFDMLHRGLTEVYQEYDLWKETYPDLAIEKSIAVVMPLPSYIFVSPDRPLLKKRLEEGLKKIMADGTFEKIFNKHFGEIIKKADLKNRKIFRIDNPNVSHLTTPFDVKEYWYQP